MIRNVIKVNLKKLAEDKKKSLLQISEETGITYATIHRIATKKVESIKLDIAEKLCSNLDCTIGELLIIDKKK